MQNFLNLTLPLKQDKASQAGLAMLLKGFETQEFTDKVKNALTGAETVHFARFMLIGNQFIQILTTFDGDQMEYAEFFWKMLNPVFKEAYKFIVDAPTGDDWTLDNFHAFNAKHQLAPFFGFSAYPDKTVREINNLDSHTQAPLDRAHSSNGANGANGAVGRTVAPGNIESARPATSTGKIVMSTVSTPKFENVQGLIVQGYKQPHSRHILLNIKDAMAGRKLLSNLHSFVTSAKVLQEEKPTQAMNLGITYNGLNALRVDPNIVDGKPATNINGFPLEFRKSGNVNPDFTGSAGFIGDSTPGEWWKKAERPFNSADIHMILHLYENSEDGLDELTERIRAHFSDQIEELFPFSGNRRIEGCRRSDLKDHFGYRDGISQPKIDWSGMNAGQDEPDFRDFLLGYANDAHQSAPPGNFAQDGSYLVFQLIYQDVAYFNQFLKTEAGKLPAVPGISDKQEWLAAKLVGRWRGGTPIVTSPLVEDLKYRNKNNFGYSNDPQGHNCPFSAHIRVGNPRDQKINSTLAPAPRLIRRGMPYGPPLNEDVDDGADRGLIGIFICASIARQYLRIARWINRNDFSPVIPDKTAQDPIQGNRGIAKASSNFQIPLPGGDVVLRGLRSFVRTQGAAFCFLPSLQTIKDLGANKYM